jgi:hypothetical protein
MVWLYRILTDVGGGGRQVAMFRPELALARLLAVVPAEGVAQSQPRRPWQPAEDEHRDLVLAG